MLVRPLDVTGSTRRSGRSGRGGMAVDEAVWPLTAAEVPSLDDGALAPLAGLLAVVFGLDGTPAPELDGSGVDGLDRLVIGMVRPFGDRPGELVLGGHMDGLHGPRVAVPEGSVVMCPRCLIDYLMDGGMRLTEWAEELITRMVAEACMARQSAPSFVIPLSALAPWVQAAVTRRDAETPASG